MKRLQLKLSSQSTSHSEKNKLVLVSYNYDTRSISYEAYLSAKVTVVKILCQMLQISSQLIFLLPLVNKK
jgi:hypothetical protein